MGVILSLPLLLGVILYAGIAKKNHPLAVDLACLRRYTKNQSRKRPKHSNY